MRTVHTPDEAIDRLGGTTPVARLLQCSYQAVFNWRTRGVALHYRDALERALAEKGFKVSTSFWRQRGAA
jgi:hypothetical protein